MATPAENTGFAFIKEAVKDKKRNLPVFSSIEKTRTELLKSKSLIKLHAVGGGSFFYKQNKIIRLRKIVKHSAIPSKYGRLLFYLAQHYKPATVIELGTSTGISTLYLALACSQTMILSIEGEKELSEIALKQVLKHKLENVKIITGRFEKEFPSLIEMAKKPVFVYLDGDHTFEATLKYFDFIEKNFKKVAILVIDDIHQSKEMEKAWNVIMRHSSVSVTVDIFRMGLVFFDKLYGKENFIIKF